MQLTGEYILNNLYEYYTDTYEEFNYNGEVFKNSKWNSTHGGWKSGVGIPEIKKTVYAIMPYFDSDGTVRCNKVLTGFITEWFPSKDKENFIFTSNDIAGPYKKYYGKNVPLSIPENHGYKEYLENFMMFDDLYEAKDALKKVIAENKKNMLQNQIKVVEKEIEDLKNDLNRKIERLEELNKELNKLK